MKTPRYLGLFAGLLGICSSASPQQNADRPPILSVETDLVTLAVTVVDRRGAFVTGLRPEHFTIYDDSERREIQFFTSEDLPATIGLVIDSSGSMRGQRARVTAAAAAFVAMRHPGDELFTLNFNEAVWPGLPPNVAFTENREELGMAVSAAPAQGMSAVYDAVDRGLDHLQLGSRDRKALIVVSDGADNASSRSLDAVLAHARRTSAVIYAVSLFERDDHDANPRVLKKLARETGGEAFTVRRGEDMTHPFERIAREIRSGYTIGFSPPDARDAGFRSLRVEVNAGDGRQLIARTRAGYYVGP